MLATYTLTLPGRMQLIYNNTRISISFEIHAYVHVHKAQAFDSTLEIYLKKDICRGQLN